MCMQLKSASTTRVQVMHVRKFPRRFAMARSNEAVSCTTVNHRAPFRTPSYCKPSKSNARLHRLQPFLTWQSAVETETCHSRWSEGAHQTARVGSLSMRELLCLNALSRLLYGQREAARRAAHLGLSQGTANKHDNALPLVLVLAMLQRQLRDLRASTEICFPFDLQAGHAIEHLPKVRCGRHQNGRLLACHCEHAHLHTGGIVA